MKKYIASHEETKARSLPNCGMLNLIRKILTWRLFSRREEVVGVWDIVKWWERRRISYNLIVGATGVFTLVVMGVCWVSAIARSCTPESGSEPFDPLFIQLMFMLVLAFIHIIGANIFYTGGWLLEIIVRKIWGERTGAFGEICFALGLVFSILLTLVPAVLFAFGLSEFLLR